MSTPTTASLSPLVPSLPGARGLVPRTDIDMPSQIHSVQQARLRQRKERVEYDRFNNTTQLMSLPARTKTILACLGEARRYQTLLDQKAKPVQPTDSLPSINTASAPRNPPKKLRRLDLTDRGQYKAVYNDVVLLTSKAYLSTATPLPEDEDAYSYTMKLLHAERPWT